MKLFFRFRYLLFLVSLGPSQANAEMYLEFAPSAISINTPSAPTRPLVADFRLGYEKLEHQFELVLMASAKDDSVNKLKVDVPLVISVLYHYLPYPESKLKLHFIVGASRVEVDTSYPGVTDTTDTFKGFSYGIGFEESFESMPQLSLSFDWIRLYDGDELDINAASLGIHYDF